MSPFFYIHTSLCASLMLLIQHSSVCMLGSFCMRLLNNVWLNVAWVTLYRQNEWVRWKENMKVINFLIPLRVLQPEILSFFLYVRCFLIKYLKLHFFCTPSHFFECLSPSHSQPSFIITVLTWARIMKSI